MKSSKVVPFLALAFAAQCAQATSFLASFDGQSGNALVQYTFGQFGLKNLGSIHPIADRMATVYTDFGPDGKLYGVAGLFSTNAPYYSIDPSTGEATKIGETVFGSNKINSDVSFDPQTGLLYGAAQSIATGQQQLFKLDLSTGVNTLIGDAPLSSDDYVGSLAFDNSGKLWAISYRFVPSVQLNLLEIDKSDASLLSRRPIITTHLYDGNLHVGADFDASTNKLYYNGPGGIFEVDTSTAGATFKQEIFSTQYATLTWIPVPEPTSAALLPFAAVLFAFRRSGMRARV